MSKLGTRAHRVASVAPRSPAKRLGVRAGDVLVAMQGEPVIDEIDYQFFSASETVALALERNGETIAIRGKKAEWEPLGIAFDAPLTGATRTCANRCVFCFVDQMPAGLRETLYVKDDDWRLSLRSGHYITLTNIGDREFARMLARRASPLYISVHATDPAARSRLLGHPRADILPRLAMLKEAGLKFHAQIVVCPGYNDEGILTQTLGDLMALHPAAQSVALVPVGLTKYRERLAPIASFDKTSAAALIERAEQWQRQCLHELGTRFVFAADELYCLAERELPPDDAYEHYPQIENGVGLLRTLEQEYLYARQDMPPARPRSVLIACGVSPANFLGDMIARHPVPGVQVEVLPVVNRFFGETVTVTGLLTGRDVADALRGRRADEVLICSSMLRSADEPVFLDDMTLDALREDTGLAVRPVGCDGSDLLCALAG